MYNNFYIARQFASSGEPCDHCQVDVVNVMDEVGRHIIGDVQEPLSYSGDIKGWMNNELVIGGTYRQGWGLPGLDLRLGERDWIKNFIIADWKYWLCDPVIPSSNLCCYAQGRWNILKMMLNFAKGDILFIPKTPDEGHFVVATVAEPYRFEDHSFEKDWRKDFGHCIAIERLMKYEYSPAHLLKRDFQSYQRAVLRVQKKAKFDRFLSGVGY